MVTIHPSNDPRRPNDHGPSGHGPNGHGPNGHGHQPDHWYRPDYGAVTRGWMTRTRRALTERPDLEHRILAEAHRNSPFLTLAEGTLSHPGPPQRIVKISMVPEGDPSEPFWRQVLYGEAERWRGLLAQHLQRPTRVARLGLPLSIPRDGLEGLVQVSELGPLRRDDLLEGTAGEDTLRLPYLVRPYIAWPRLSDVGFSHDQLRLRWESFCAENGLDTLGSSRDRRSSAASKALCDALFHHFCDEALVNVVGEVLLTSAWRFDALR